MVILGWVLAIAVAVVVIAIAVLFLNRFYRKSTRDIALVRTGFGGQRILISGGCLALPFLHKVEEINMRTLRIEVRRAGDKSVITEDRMRVDVELEFYVRVDSRQPKALPRPRRRSAPNPSRSTAFAICSKAVSSTPCRRWRRATRWTACTRAAPSLSANISDLLRDNLKQNGILLDSVSLTRLDQSAFSSFDENNAFNAVGLRKLAEIIAVNRKKRAEIEADADISVRQTQLEATKQRLILTQQEEEAQINQHLEIEKIRAASDAEAAKAREEAMIASEEARIERERQTRATEVAKQSQLRKLEVELQLGVEMKKVDSAIQLAAKHVEEAKSRAQAELARTEVVLAEEHVQTERDRAVADRSHEIALKRVNEQGAVEQAKAETEAGVLLRRIRAEVRGGAHQGGSRAFASARPVRRRTRGHRGGELTDRRADPHEARAISARPAARDRLADDEAGREDRLDPHSSAQRLRRQRSRAGRQGDGAQKTPDQSGDGQHSRHGAAASGAAQHRRFDRAGLRFRRRAVRHAVVEEKIGQKKTRDAERSEK